MLHARCTQHKDQARLEELQTERDEFAVREKKVEEESLLLKNEVSELKVRPGRGSLCAQPP